MGDTHWLRSDFDHLILEQTIAAGVQYFDRTFLTDFDPGPPWRLGGMREGEAIEVSANFVVDASGFGAALPTALGIDCSPRNMRTRSWSIYSHFTGVEPWGKIQRELGADLSAHPFACDDAALHHIMPDGWIWVLRFDNGVTSAGMLLDRQLHPADLSLSPAHEWEMIVSRYPSIARQFQSAEPILQWQRTGIIQRRAGRVAGENWALVSSAAYSLDAMFSTGNAHAMLTIQRLAKMLDRHIGKPSLAAELAGYERSMQREIDFLDHLVHGCYLSFRWFPLLTAWTMYYFTGAIAAEHRRRNGISADNEEILSSHIPAFQEAVMRSYRDLLRMNCAGGPTTQEIQAFERQVAADIAPWNVARLCDPAKMNLYPFG